MRNDEAENTEKGPLRCSSVETTIKMTTTKALMIAEVIAKLPEQPRRS
jgi:hypothetical protein